MTLHITEKGATYTEPAWPAASPSWGEVTIKEWLLMEVCKEFTADPSFRNFERLKDRFEKSMPDAMNFVPFVRWISANAVSISRISHCMSWESEIDARVFWAWLHGNRDLHADDAP